MSKKEAIKKKINERKDRAVTLARGIYHGDASLSGAWHRVVNALKVLIVSGRKFVKDECFTRGSSITYTIILSLVPMLTVALTIFSLYYGVGKDEKELFDQVVRLLGTYGITMNIEPIINMILGLVNNAGKIGGISAAIMIFSATALFRSLENSLNAIWKIRKGRPLHLKIVYYWGALTLGPVLLAAGLYVAARLSTLISPLNTIIGFLAPFAIIWLLFLMAYITLPNMKMPFRPAAIGASVTSAVWVLFIMLFNVYVRSFAKSTFAIYGALAAIPLFLLLVYASSLIILYGAEVACTLMYPGSYRSLKTAFSDREELHLYPGLALLRHVYRKFESGGGPTQRKELGKAAPGMAAEIDRYLRLFLDAKLVMQGDDGGLLPSMSSSRLALNDVIDTVMHISMTVPAHGGPAQSRHFLARLFGKIDSSRRAAVGKLTLKDLIDRG
jgi:YihY family inner membrane protein